MKALCLVLVALAVSVSSALMQAYSVEPVKASWSGWTGFQDTVSQTVTCCWDELDSTCYVQLFVGRNWTSSGYDLRVKDDSTSTQVAHKYGVSPQGDHRWLRFEDLDIDGEFTKGKKYRFEFTRSGSDSIQYYWDGDPNGPIGNDPYKYGQLVIGGTGQPTRDLCMRCYGLLDPIDSTFWGIDIPSVC